MEKKMEGSCRGRLEIYTLDSKPEPLKYETVALMLRRSVQFVPQNKGR
jgi:hypothetical protein